MDVTIKKVSQSENGERFVLIDAESRRVLTVHDISEKSLRRFFAQRGAPTAMVDDCLERARQRYAETADAQTPVDEATDTKGDDDLLADLGLGDDA